MRYFNLLLGLMVGMLLTIAHPIFSQVTVVDHRYTVLATPLVAGSSSGSDVYFLAATMGVYELSASDSLAIREISSVDETLKAYFYPNPFYIDSGSELGYELKTDMDVQIRIYNMMGHQIFRQSYPAGAQGGKGIPFYNKVRFDRNSLGGYDVSSGIYFFVIIHDGKVIQKGKFAVRPGKGQ